MATGARKASSPGPPGKPARPAPSEAPAAPAWSPVPEAVNAPATEAGPVHEPVWLVRIVLVLFLVGFAAFLAREVSNFVGVLP